LAVGVALADAGNSLSAIVAVGPARLPEFDQGLYPTNPATMIVAENAMSAPQVVVLRTLLLEVPFVS
jgi:hypothetical protein